MQVCYLNRRLMPSLITASLFYCVCSVTQSCLTLCDPMDCISPGSSVPGIFPGKHTGVGCCFLPQRTFPTQRSHLHLPCLMHWLVDFLPPCHLGSTFNNFLFGPSTLFFYTIFFFSFDSASNRLSNVSFIGIIPYYYAFEFKSRELVK